MCVWVLFYYNFFWGDFISFCFYSPFSLPWRLNSQTKYDTHTYYIWSIHLNIYKIDPKLTRRLLSCVCDSKDAKEVGGGGRETYNWTVGSKFIIMDHKQFFSSTSSSPSSSWPLQGWFEQFFSSSPSSWSLWKDDLRKKIPHFFHLRKTKKNCC